MMFSPPSMIVELDFSNLNSTCPTMQWYKSTNSTAKYQLPIDLTGVHGVVTVQNKILTNSRNIVYRDNVSASLMVAEFDDELKVPYESGQVFSSAGFIPSTPTAPKKNLYFYYHNDKTNSKLSNYSLAYTIGGVSYYVDPGLKNYGTKSHLVSLVSGIRHMMSKKKADDSGQVSAPDPDAAKCQ